MAEDRPYRIYFDMDSVLADFDRGVIELAHTQVVDIDKRTREEDDAMWEAIRKVDHFYDKLEMMPDARLLFDTVYGQMPGRCEILTGIPKERRGITTAGEDKTEWAHRLLSPDIKVNITYKEEKKNFVTGPECVLIDDLQANIDGWNQAGGTGILHKDAESTLMKMRSLGIIE